MSGVLVQAPDGALLRKPLDELGPGDMIVIDGPDAFAAEQQAQARLDAEIAAAGGLEAWRALPPRDDEGAAVELNGMSVQRVWTDEAAAMAEAEPAVDEALARGERIAAAALGYVGTPYRHQGRTPGTMLDCAGVPICAARRCGIVPPAWDVTGYLPMAGPQTLADACDRWMQRVARSDLRAGDVIVVRYRDGDPQHIGVLYGHPWGGLGMVHASNQHGRVVAQRLMFSAFTRFVAAWRMPALVA